MSETIGDIETINLEPDWPNLLEWSATMLAQHGFDRNAYSPVVSLMEMALKVYQDDPKMFKQICDALMGKEAINNLAAEIVIGPATTPNGPKPSISVHYHEPNHPQNGESVRCRYCDQVILYSQKLQVWETPDWIKKHNG